jgi:hypothetical protein
MFVTVLTETRIGRKSIYRFLPVCGFRVWEECDVWRHFHSEADDAPVSTTEKEFEIEFINTLLESALISIKGRLKQLHEGAETWGLQ